MRHGVWCLEEDARISWMDAGEIALQSGVLFVGQAAEVDTTDAPTPPFNSVTR